MKEANKNTRSCKRIDIIHVEKDSDCEIEIFANLVLSPTMLIAGRLFIDAKYLFRSENLVIMSSRGNQKYAQDYMNSTDLEGHTLASCVISA